MNESKKKSLSELIQLMKDGKVPQEDKNQVLKPMKNELIKGVKSVENIDVQKKEGSIHDALRDKVASNTSSLMKGNTLVSDVDMLSEIAGASTLTNTTSSNSNLVSSQGYNHFSEVILYRDLLPGVYYLNFRGAVVSKEAIALMDHTIEQMRAKVQYYGENSATITGKTWAEHFKAYVAPDINWASPVGKDYLYILYAMDVNVATKKMTISTLNSLKYVLDNSDSIHFDFEKLSAVVTFMLGIVTGMGDPSVQDPLLYLHILKSHYENNDMENFSSMLNVIIDLFLAFTNRVVSTRTHLNFINPISTDNSQVPCGYYIQREDYEDGTMLTTSFSFEIYGKRIYSTFYWVELPGEYYQPITYQSMFLEVYQL